MWTALCAAAQNISTLIVFRLLSGAFGSVCLVIPVGQLSDIFEAEQRGIAQAIYAAVPFLGSTLGPAVGGFLSSAAGWRWLMGFLALFTATMTFVVALLIPETYPPVLLRRRAQLLSKTTGRIYMTQIDFEQPLVLKEVVWRSFCRPWVLLFREPIVLLISVCIGQQKLSVRTNNALSDLRGSRVRHPVLILRCIPYRVSARIRLECRTIRTRLFWRYGWNHRWCRPDYPRQQAIFANSEGIRWIGASRVSLAPCHSRRSSRTYWFGVVCCYSRSQYPISCSYLCWFSLWPWIYTYLHVLFELPVSMRRLCVYSNHSG
jgi:hypothetical protein